MSLRAYAERVAPGSTVLDIGFGRGEFLPILANRCVKCQGINQAVGIVLLGRDHGLSVEVAAVHEYLASRADHFDVVFAGHVTEHFAGGAIGGPGSLSRLGAEARWLAASGDPQARIN